MLIRIVLFSILVACVLTAHFAYEIKHGVPEAVAKLVDEDIVLQNMRSAKFDCTSKIPRTQECVLVYEYVPIYKGGE